MCSSDLRWDLGVGFERSHDTDEVLAAEGDSYPHTGLGVEEGIAWREVVEKPSQGRIERNAQNIRVRQFVTPRVFHSACG